VTGRCRGLDRLLHCLLDPLGAECHSGSVCARNGTLGRSTASNRVWSSCLSQTTRASRFSGGVCSGLVDPNTATCGTPNAARDMHQAGVVAHHAGGAADQSHGLGEGGLTRHHAAGAVGLHRDRVTQFDLLARPQQQHRRAVALVQFPGQGGVVLCRPALGGTVLRARCHDPIGRVRQRERLAHLGAVVAVSVRRGSGIGSSRWPASAS